MPYVLQFWGWGAQTLTVREQHQELTHVKIWAPHLQNCKSYSLKMNFI